MGLLTRRGAVLATVLALCAGVPAAASAGPGPVAPAAAAPQVTVMTWNVWGAEDGVPSGWRKVLRNQRADIVSLQEICKNQADRLRRQLREDHLDYQLTWREANWHPTACWGGHQGQAILTRKAKVSVVAGSVERYEYKSSDSQYRGYVALMANIAGQRVRVLNTHPWNDTGAWTTPTSNVKELADLSKRWTGPQILTGDFNALPRMVEPLYRDGGFRDAADPAPDPWAHPGRPTYKSMKLDYILYRGGPETVGQTKVLDSPSSDHRLVLATFRLSGNP